MRKTALWASVLLCACGGGKGGTGGGSGGGSGGGAGGGSGSKTVKVLNVSGTVSLTGTETDTTTTWNTTSSTETISFNAESVMLSGGISGTYLVGGGGHQFHMQVPMLVDQSPITGTATSLGTGTSSVNLPGYSASKQTVTIDAQWTNDNDFTMAVVGSPCPATANTTVPNANPLTFDATAAEIESGSFTFTATAPVTDMSDAGVRSWDYQRTVNLTVVGQLQ